MCKFQTTILFRRSERFPIIFDNLNINLNITLQKFIRKINRFLFRNFNLYLISIECLLSTVETLVVKYKYQD